MTALVFIALMAFSVVLAFMAKRGVIADSMDDVMVAGRSFGAFMVFFVTVGETYGTVSYTHLTLPTILRV